MIASNIWKKGITLPQVEVFLNISGGKEDTAAVQKRGRVLGTTEDKKKALTIDIIDEYDDFFSEHCLERIKAYEKEAGEENIDVIVISDTVDIQKTILEYVKNWFA